MSDQGPTRQREAAAPVDTRSKKAAQEGFSMSTKRIHPRLVLGVLFVLLVSSLSTSAKESPEPSSVIDSIMSSAFPADGPGAAIIVTRDGKTLFRKGYGMADMGMGVRDERDMVFGI